MTWEPWCYGGWNLMNGPHSRVAWVAEKESGWDAGTDVSVFIASKPTLDEAKRYCVQNLIQHHKARIAEHTEQIKKLEELL